MTYIVRRLAEARNRYMYTARHTFCETLIQYKVIVVFRGFIMPLHATSAPCYDPLLSQQYLSHTTTKSSNCGYKYTELPSVAQKWQHLFDCEPSSGHFPRWQQQSDRRLLIFTLTWPLRLPICFKAKRVYSFVMFLKGFGRFRRWCITLRITGSWLDPIQTIAVASVCCTFVVWPHGPEQLQFPHQPQ
jgi:hypothetical protein